MEPVLGNPDATRIEFLLRRIIQDLPLKRDWLDPAIETEARQLLRLEPTATPEANTIVTQARRIMALECLIGRLMGEVGQLRQRNDDERI